MTAFETFHQAQRQRVSDGQCYPLCFDCRSPQPLMIVLWPQLGDFDSLEYAFWLQRESEKIQALHLQVRAVGIGNRQAGQRFCEFTGFPADWLYLDPQAELHQQVGLYPGLRLKLPGLSAAQAAGVNLMLMCAGVGSPGTIKEVLRGYTGDRSAPQLIADEAVIQASPLPPLKGRLFARAGGTGFQRPFELATLRLRNMGEVLSHWQTYVPDASLLTQRGGTFVYGPQRQLLYEHRDRGLLGFAKQMARPLEFLDSLPGLRPRPSPGDPSRV
ncbi:peroxiredoxin-like family protein [Lyngbya confervoides]|uniref:AhpC/TSA family protein n=1 Tax=Lyngbya confervoides BDU141951 TaxID=1574623 RepID=A0ABD4T492_9CYAN|nr:peroxiredoxin-like family protein [Lyngbya confervoides]MCM1983303.1 AhpC/TSA family protein [Lyngbya confervoides BDU141951]